MLSRASASTPRPELDSLRDRGAQLTLAFSGKEPLRDALEDKGFFADLSRWPNVRIEKLRGSDHTLRPVPAQLAARAVLLRGFGAA